MVTHEEMEKEYSKKAEHKLTIEFKNLGCQRDFWYALSHDNGQTLINVLREQKIKRSLIK